MADCRTTRSDRHSLYSLSGEHRRTEEGDRFVRHRSTVDDQTISPRAVATQDLPSDVSGEAGHPIPFDFRGLRCIPSGVDAYTWYVLPKDADLERDASGRPMLTMIDLGSSGFLSFTARWAASASDLDALRIELASRAGVDDARLITLSFAPIQSPRCHVSIRDRAGDDQVIATSTTSGYPPYNAAFGLQLEGENLDAAKAAIAGERNRVRVDYQADLRAPIAATARFVSTDADFLPWLRSRSAREDLRAALEEAIRTGRAEVRIDETEPGAADVADELRDRALRRAEQVLPRWLEGYETGEVRIDVTVERAGTEPVRVIADIGEITTTGPNDPV